MGSIRKTRARIPLLKLYFGFVIIIIVTIFITSGWFSYRNYEVYLDLKDNSLQTQLIKISYDFEERLAITEYLMHLFANRVHTSRDYSLHNIARNIAHQEITKMQNNTLSWTFLSYVNSELKLVANGNSGILEKPIDIRGKRPNFIYDPGNNNALIFDGVSTGLISLQPIIPTAFALYDKNNNFHGYLVAGIEITLINRMLSRIKEDFITYVILDGDGNFVTSSNHIESDSSLMTYLKQAVKITQQVNTKKSHKHNTLKLPSAFKQGDYIYTHYTRLPNYPFYIVVGERENYYYNDYKKEVVPQIFRNILIGIAISGVLLFLSYHVVKPIMDLSINANKIARGLKVSSTTEYIAEEFNALNSLLMQIHDMASKLRSKQQEVVRANSKLHTANAIIRSNISFMTHELQNPNYSVIGYAKLIAKAAKLNEVQNDALKMIIQSAEYQATQIDYFLNLFKFQHTGKDIVKEYSDINHILHWAISMLKSIALEKNIRIKCEIAQGLPYFHCDSIMFGQMLQNLISNAIKYNKQDGTILINAYVQENLHQNFLVISVEDEGEGISEADQARLFKRFERLARAHNLGYGLGLVYVKQCVLNHDGSIKVSSQLGQGTKFTLKFLL